MSYGDKNSAFFHATINQRRQHNQIVMLKANSGDWVRDDEGINELILEHFSNLYEHFGLRDFSNILSVVDNVILEGMNLSLIRDV